jgi:hypothetical protein
VDITFNTFISAQRLSERTIYIYICVYVCARARVRYVITRDAFYFLLVTKSLPLLLRTDLLRSSDNKIYVSRRLQPLQLPAPANYAYGSLNFSA